MRKYNCSLENKFENQTIDCKQFVKLWRHLKRSASIWPKCSQFCTILTNIRQIFSEKIINFNVTFEFGAVHKCANLVDQKQAATWILNCKIGFDTAEEEPSILFSYFLISDSPIFQNQDKI